MESTTAGTSRLERILASMVAGVIGASILCFLAVLIGGLAGASAAQAAGEGVWWVIIMFPYFGLPAGILILIALVIVSSLRRSREARAQH